MGKTVIKCDARFRLTLPKELQKRLALHQGDDIWYDVSSDGRIVIGKVEVTRKCID